MAVDVRVTNARVMVDEEPDFIDVLVTNARAMVEEGPDFIDVLVTNTRLMIENNNWFYSATAITEAGDTLIGAGDFIIGGVVVPVSRTKTPSHHQQRGLSISVSGKLWDT